MPVVDPEAVGPVSDSEGKEVGAPLLEVEVVLVEYDDVVDGVVVEEVEDEVLDVVEDVVVVVLGGSVWKLTKLVPVICPSVVGAGRVMSSTPSRPQHEVLSLLFVLQQ